MKLVCPKCGPREDATFHVTAHVTERWEVTTSGEYIEPVEGQSVEVIHWPDNEDRYECGTCGEEAQVIE